MKDMGHKSLYKKITILAVVIVAAVVTVYLASPLFISTKVNEPFPPNSDSASVSFEDFSTMTEGERAKAAENMSTSQKNELMTRYANLDNSNDTNIINETMNETVSISSSSAGLNNSVLSGSFIGSMMGFTMLKVLQK